MKHDIVVETFNLIEKSNVTNSILTSNDLMINFTTLQFYDLTSSIISSYLYITLLLHNYYSRYIVLCKSFMLVFDIYFRFVVVFIFKKK